MSAKKSRYGVYYDLEASPYEYRTQYGDVFKFGRKEKLEIYNRDEPKESARMNSIIERNEMTDFLPDDIIRLLHRTVYRSFYRKIEG